MKLKRYGIVVMIVLALMVSVGVVNAQQGDGGTGGRRSGRGGVLSETARLRGLSQLVQIVADATGLTPLEIVRQVRQGSTLSEIITANGGSVEDVKAQAVEKGTASINQAVANGRITQERADQMLANLETRIDQALSFDPMLRQMQREIVLRVAGETGLSVREVMQQWRDGSTLSAILTSANEDIQAFIDETITRAQARLDQAVTSGRLTQQQADQRLNDLKSFLPDFLNQPFPITTPAETTIGV